MENQKIIKLDTVEPKVRLKKPKRIRETPEPRDSFVKQHYIVNDFGQIEGSFNQLKQKNFIAANKRLLKRNLVRGFNPEWYIVIHFNDGGGNKKYQRRRIDPIDVEADVLAVKLKLYQLLYGRGWETMKRRSRSYWTVEYGSSCIKPHLNILIESLPQGWNDIAVIQVLFNKLLPRKAKCLWSNTAKVNKIHNDPMIYLNHYVNKESNFFNSTIQPKANDYIRTDKKLY